MPSEAIITRVEQIFSDISLLGGQAERTSIITGLEVVDISITGQPNLILVKDSRDGDFIYAVKVPGVLYAVSDLVNVLFIEGTEPVAMQQSAGSSGSPVAVSKLVSPDLTIDPVISADNSGDVTIAGTGDLIIPDQIIHSGDTDNNITFTDDVQTFNVGGIALLALTEAAQDIINLGPSSGDIDIDFNGDMFLRGSDGRFGVGSTTPDAYVEIDNPSSENVPVLAVRGTISTGIIFDVNTDVLTSATPQLLRFIPQIEPTGVIANALGINANPKIGGASSNNITVLQMIQSSLRFADTWSGTVGTFYSYRARVPVDIGAGAPAITTHYGFHAETLNFATTNWAFYSAGATDSHLGGDVSIGATVTPLAQCHIDQSSDAANEPVLLLDQADVSEPFTKYIGTAAAATLTQSIVAEADVTTATRQGFVKIEIEDIGNQVTDQDYFVPFYTLA